MPLNLFAIKERIKAIIEADLTYATVHTIEPDIITKAATCVLFTGQFDSPFVSGSEGKHNVNVDCYWFVRGITEQLKTVRQFEIDGIIQDFTEAFMRRPRLMLNDNGLDYVQGDIQLIPTVRPTTQIITYPIGVANAPQYRGFQSRIIVPYRVTYELRD